MGAHLATKVPEYNNGAQHPQHGKILDPKLNKGDFVFALPRGPSPPKQTGSIFVSSQPAGAQVMLAGVLQARRTPVQIQDVMAGTHMLKLTLEDYEDYTQQIIVEAGPRDASQFHAPTVAPAPAGDSKRQIEMAFYHRRGCCSVWGRCRRLRTF